MRIVEYTDELGWMRRSLIKDNMRPEQAVQGIPRNPPDLSQLNCEDILRELNNLIVERGLFTIADLNKNPNSLRGAVLGIIYPKIIDLYKNHHQSGLNGGHAPATKVKPRPKEAVNEKSS
jgi:hypothetical protein